MFNFFETIVGYFETFWAFFTNSLNSLVMLLDTALSAVELPVLLINIAPSFLAASISAVMLISVAKLVIGR